MLPDPRKRNFSLLASFSSVAYCKHDSLAHSFMQNRLGVFPGVPAVEIQVGLFASTEHHAQADRGTLADSVLTRESVHRRSESRLSPPFTCPAWTASVTEAELHWEVLFVGFESGHVAVFLDDPAMEDAESEMGCKNGCGGEDKVLDACLDPRFSDNRERGHGGNEGEVFEDRYR